MPNGPQLDELGEGLTRSQGWSGFVQTDIRALAAKKEDERWIRLSKKKKREAEKERKGLSE